MEHNAERMRASCAEEEEEAEAEAEVEAVRLKRRRDEAGRKVPFGRREMGCGT